VGGRAGWIAFVVLSFAIGGAVGTNKLKDEDGGNGESKRAAQIIAGAGLKDRASEQVLIQSRGALRAKDPEFRAAVADVIGRHAR
jgi:putative drug exporter of the RND superfamily